MREPFIVPDLIARKLFSPHVQICLVFPVSKRFCFQLHSVAG